MNMEKIKQFIKFGFVGASNTIISLTTYYILVFLRCPYILANAVGFILSVINSYFWNSRFVFKNKQEESGAKAFGKVFLSYLGSFCISTVLITVMVELWGISEYIAPILRLIVTVPLNYMVNKIWAFRDNT